MTTADSILVFTFLIAAVGTAGAALLMQKSLMWLISAVMWTLCAIIGVRLTTAPWDTMAFLTLMSIGLLIACVLMALQTRRMQTAEDAGGQAAPDDVDNYVREAEGYGEQQKRVSAATGGLRVHRARRQRRGKV